MRSKLFVGQFPNFPPPVEPYLWIDDHVPTVPYARYFKPEEDTFNILRNITDKKAKELTRIIYTYLEGGTTTLTVRNGKIELPYALKSINKLDKLSGTEELDMIRRGLLFSSTIRHILCSPKQSVSFNPRAKLIARLNRSELGDDDALLIGQLLISEYKGLVVIPHLEFYGKDFHTYLIREDRLIAGIDTFANVTPKLRSALMTMDITPNHCLYRDAVLIAELSRLRPDPLRADNEYTTFIDQAMR